MFINNYYFFLGQGEGRAYGVLAFKVLSAEEQDDGIIVLGQPPTRFESIYFAVIYFCFELSGLSGIVMSKITVQCFR